MLKPLPDDHSPGFHLEITEDDEHYYVSIDRDYRERAKSVPGRVWNAAITKWVYPRAPETLAALQAEFSDRPDAFKLKTVSASPPAKSSAPARNASVQSSASLAHNSPKAATHNPPSSTPQLSNSSPRLALPASPTNAQLEFSLNKIHQMLVEERNRSVTLQQWLAAIDKRLASVPQRGPSAPQSAAPVQPSGIDLEELEASFAQVDRIHDLIVAERKRTAELEARLEKIQADLAKLPSQFPKLSALPPSSTVSPVTNAELMAEVRAALAQFAERIGFDQAPSTSIGNDSRILTAWLSRIVVRGTSEDPTFVDLCEHWDLIRDDLRVINDLEEQLKKRLRESLNLPDSSKKSLHELCDEYHDSVQDKDQSKLLSSFRIHRNKLIHEPRVAEPLRWLHFLHALTAIALVWPKLSQAPQRYSDDSADDDT